MYDPQKSQHRAPRSRGGCQCGDGIEWGCSGAIPIGNSTMSDCAPDNFWTLLGSLIEMGGWALILIVIIPMVFSWLMPGPIQFKKRKNGG